MSDKSGIQWTDSTWNPVVGCSRVSEGCRNCYAERLAVRMEGNPNVAAYDGIAKSTAAGPRWTGEVRIVPEKLDQPLRWKKPRRIFVNSMSDLFHERLGDEEIAAVFGVMAACPQHTFQVLTKRPERAVRWFGVAAESGPLWCDTEACQALGKARLCNDLAAWPPPNVELGTSVEDQATADERIPYLLQCPAAVRFVSCEPLIGPVDLSRWLPNERIRDSVSGPGEPGFLLGGRRGADLAAQAIGAGDHEDRRHRSADASKSRDKFVGGAPQRSDQIPARDVHMGREEAQGERPSDRMDDRSRQASPSGTGDQSQERRRRGQPAGELGGRDRIGERAARDTDSRTTPGGSERIEKPGSEVGRAADTGDTRALLGGRPDAGRSGREVRRYPAVGVGNTPPKNLEAPTLDWLICGGESGPRARPLDVEWARSVRDQCREAGTAFFMKQAGRTCKMRREDAVVAVALGAGWKAADAGGETGTVEFVDRHGGDPDEWPEDLRIREFPGEARPA